MNNKEIFEMLLTLCKNEELSTFKVADIVSALQSNKSVFLHTKEVLDKDKDYKSQYLSCANGHMIHVQYGWRIGQFVACINIWPDIVISCPNPL